MTISSTTPTSNPSPSRETDAIPVAQGVLLEEKNFLMPSSGATQGAQAFAQPTVTPTTLTRTVQVTAPADLAGGYRFNVDTGATTMLLVEVPAHGVKAGSLFNAIVISESARGSHNIPSGRWRDGLCECCTFGCCHPQCCLTFWCTGCALGQVLTRMKLDWCAQPLNGRQPSWSAFKIWFVLVAMYLIVSNVLSVVVQTQTVEKTVTYTTNESSQNNWFGEPTGGNSAESSSWTVQNIETTNETPGWVQGVAIISNLMYLAYFFTILIVTTCARSYIRGKYSIPASCCQGCEDCCCAFWCTPCTICQMARHTADYRNHQASCCTENGLDAGVPEPV